MPQLLSRMDDAGWLTPAIAEILDSLPPLPYDERFRREQAALLQKRLNDSGVPARVVRVGVFPSLTLYALQSSGSRRRGAQAAVTAERIAEVVPRLKEALRAEEVGVVPSLRRSPDFWKRVTSSLQMRVLTSLNTKLRSLVSRMLRRRFISAMMRSAKPG